MKTIKIFLFLIPLILHGGRIRTVYMDNQSSAQINLNLTKTTILSFVEKPTRTIIGNQNYFNVEFTGNDIPIQPLGLVRTNFFVYTSFNRFAFILNSSSSGVYDDIVYIRRKRPPSEATETPVVTKPIVKDISFDRTSPSPKSKKKKNHESEITLSKLSIEPVRQLILIDLIVKPEAQITLKKDLFKLQRKSTEIPIKAIVFENENLSKGESTKLRIVTSIQKEPFSVVFKNKKALIGSKEIKELLR